MMEAVRTSETSVDNHFTWQYIPEDNSEHHTRRRENLKSHIIVSCCYGTIWDLLKKGTVCEIVFTATFSAASLVFYFQGL
jgi:hypothetical protein